jgi:hypothetical protein
MHSKHKLTTISVSQGNYLALKRLGNAGDSFNDVITEILKNVKSPLQTDSGVGRSAGQSTAVAQDSEPAQSNHTEDGSKHE